MLAALLSAVLRSRFWSIRIQSSLLLLTVARKLFISLNVHVGRFVNVISSVDR